MKLYITRLHKGETMKKVAFAYIYILMDFTSYEDAKKYKNDHKDNGWWFGEIYENANDNGFNFSMEVRKPYLNYNGGW